jgi:hypothetical protein
MRTQVTTREGASVLKEPQGPENTPGSRAPDAEGHPASVAAALREAELLVEALGPSAGQQRLKQMLSVVRRSLGAWDLQPPSPRQLAFLTRIIEDILREATAGSHAEGLPRTG